MAATWVAGLKSRIKIYRDPQLHSQTWDCVFKAFQFCLTETPGCDEKKSPPRHQQKELFDFISQSVDRRVYYYNSPQGPLELFRNSISVRPRVSHLIWQIGETDAIKVLYLFVNVTNTATQVEFVYDKGLATPPGVNWTKTITWISDAGNSQSVGTVKFGQGEKQIIPPRSFMSVELKRWREFRLATLQLKSFGNYIVGSPTESFG